MKPCGVDLSKVTIDDFETPAPQQVKTALEILTQSLSQSTFDQSKFSMPIDEAIRISQCAISRLEEYDSTISQLIRKIQKTVSTLSANTSSLSQTQRDILPIAKKVFIDEILVPTERKASPPITIPAKKKEREEASSPLNSTDFFYVKASPVTLNYQPSAVRTTAGGSSNWYTYIRGIMVGADN